MSKVLILLTAQFPFGKAESFLESEYEYYNKFDRVLICPLEKQSNLSCRKLDNKMNNILVVNCSFKISLVSKIIQLIKAIFKLEFWHEFFRVFKRSKKILLSIKELLSFTSTCDIIGEKTLNAISEYIESNDVLFVYSYWLYTQAYTAAFIKQHVPNARITVSRCHGFDIYEERNNGFLPYRRYLFNNLDKICCISNNGRNYLVNLYPLYKSKFSVSRLGTKDYGVSYTNKKNGCIRIVSCSSCIPLKRIHLIIEALSHFGNDSINIEWTHFGEGELYEQLKNTANRTLPENVVCDFRGYVSNQDLMFEYSNNDYDVFINVSSTEGIPVSIMEAMSFGIPAIASNVGGTNEIVIDGFNGFLIDSDFIVEGVVNKLKHLISISETDYIRLRTNARLFWNQNFFAKDNYKKFLHDLMDER